MTRNLRPFLFAFVALISFVLIPSFAHAGGKGDQEQQQIQQEIDENQDQISSNKEQITIFVESNREIEKILNRDDDELGSACDCRASQGSCEKSVFTELGLNPESSTSCEDLWEKQPKLNKIPYECRQAVRSCKRISKKIAKQENRKRISELEAENRDYEAKNRKLKIKIKEKVKVTESSDGPCADCNRDRGSAWNAIVPGAVSLGLGAMNMITVNRGIDAYYGAYNNSVNRYYNAYNLSAQGYYNSIPALAQHYTALGIPMPTNGFGPPLALTGAMAMPGTMGLYGSLNPYAMLNTGGYNPYLMVNGGGWNGFNGGLNAGIYANIGLPGYALNSGWMTPYANGSASVGAFSPFYNNGGAALMYQQAQLQQAWMLNGQQLQYAQYGLSQAQQNYQAAYYRYQAVSQQAYANSLSFAGGYSSPYSLYGAGGVGIGLQFGLGTGWGGSAFGGGQSFLPAYPYSVGGGSTF